MFFFYPKENKLNKGHNNLNGQVVNIGSGFEVSIGETATAIAEVMGVAIEIETDSKCLRPEKSELKRLWADNTKVRRLFGWEPNYGGKAGFKLGLQKTAEWFSHPGHLKIYKAGMDIFMNRNLDLAHIVSLLKSIVSNQNEPVPLHEPLFAGKEWIYVKDCLDTGWVSSAGKYIDKFDKS